MARPRPTRLLFFLLPALTLFSATAVALSASPPEAAAPKNLPITLQKNDDLERQRLVLEQERIALDKKRLEQEWLLRKEEIGTEKRRNLYLLIGGLGALFTILISLSTFLANQDAKKREHFEAEVQALTSRQEEVDVSRRLAAANALPHFYNARSWLLLPLWPPLRVFRLKWGSPFRHEVVNLIAACFKTRAVKSRLRKPFQIPSGQSAASMPEQSGEGAADVKPEPPEETILYEALASAIRSISETAAAEPPEHFIGKVLAFLHIGRGHLPFAGVDMAETDLRGLNLDHVNFVHLDLSEAHLQRAHLWGANLQYADLCDANLQGARLWGANLQAALWGANLQGAELWEANLQGASLGEANLQGARLGGANLQGARLEGAENLDKAIFSEKTILPDGTKWWPGRDLTRFANPQAKGEEKGE